MTTNEILDLANKEAPVLMKKTAAMVYLLETLDPELAKEVTNDFAEIASHVEEKTKTAGFADSAKAFGKDVGSAAAKGTAAAIVAGLGTAIATDLFHRAKRGLSSHSNWKSMMDANPHLKDFDQAQVRRSFKSVQKYAPDIASDPMAAGALTYKLTHSSGDQDLILRGALELQEKAVKNRFGPFQAPGKFDFTRPPSAEDEINKIKLERMKAGKES